MDNFPWLTLMIVIPLIGGVVTAIVGRRSASRGREVGLAFALVALVFSLGVAAGYWNALKPGSMLQTNSFVETHTWIKAFGAHYALGLNGIGLVMVVLTTLLTPVVMLASWRSVSSGRWAEHGFFAWALVLEALSIAVFTASDVFLFYIVFEATLIPMYFLIGGYGSGQRQYAAVKFLLYSLAGGLIMLAGVVGLYVVSARSGQPSFLLSDLASLQIDTNTERWIFVAFMIAFAIKAPMVPVHTWLPDAAAASTPGTSVLLVGVLDKIGTFGMLKFGIGLFPDAAKWAAPAMLVLGVISVLYGALAAIGQQNILRLIAYTSISHFGFMVIGIFAFTSQALTGAAMYMFNHGLSTAALFLVAGFLIQRGKSQRIGDYGGVEKVTPVLAGCFLFAGLSSLALPGLSPFVSEFLVLAGTFAVNKPIAIIAVLATVLAALYILIMYQRIFTGPGRGPRTLSNPKDLSPREKIVLVPLLGLILLLGVYPHPLTRVISPDVPPLQVAVGVTDPAPSEGGR